MKVQQQQFTYSEPTIQRLALGKKPATEFNDKPQASRDYVGISEAPASGATVWGDVPLKNADGTPALHQVTANLDLTPRSPLKYGLIAGGIGAAMGALAGFYFGDAWTAAAGGVGLGIVSGGASALAVKNDHVKVVWTPHQILDHKMAGYHEFVGIGERDGKQGYFHRYIPDVKEQVIGTYKTPHTEHCKETETK